jgi:hypothetical protein
MAITTTIIGINTGNLGTWNSSDLINQFETAFKWLGWHGGTQTGLVIGISSISGGGTVGSAATYYQSVRQSSTTGVGTGALFYVGRSIYGKVSEIYLNRPGYGYTGGEVVTLSAADIGGSANGAADLSVKVCIAGTVSGSVSYAVTFNSVYAADGTDRSGIVSSTSGIGTVITVYEGDTLTLTNNNSNPATRTLNIIWNPNQSNLNPGTSPTGAASSTRVFNAIRQGVNVAGAALTITFQPGQAGNYWITDDQGGYTPTPCPRIVVLPATGTITPVGVGSTASFYDKDIASAQKYGILRHTIQQNKFYGDTYRGFITQSGVTEIVDFIAGSGYNPNSDPDAARSSNLYNGGAGAGKRFAGSANLDYSTSNILTASLTSALCPSASAIIDYTMTSSFYGSTNTYANKIRTGNNTAYQLDLNIYRSGIDPNFVVFSYKAPTLSSTHLLGKTFSTFFFHNFTTNLWDLNDVFLGGFTIVHPLSNPDTVNSSYETSSSVNASLTFRTSLSATKKNQQSSVQSQSNPTKRMAEFGYAAYMHESFNENLPYSTMFANATYRATTASPSSYDTAGNATSQIKGYFRDSNVVFRNRGGYSNSADYGNRGNESLASTTNYNAVIKGIPLNATFMPVPYYIPDDFVLIQFYYTTPSANIQQGDTITISGSEVYTVITGQYDNSSTTSTKGILFCARTV